jgi:hypothetical protein
MPINFRKPTIVSTKRNPADGFFNDPPMFLYGNTICTINGTSLADAVLNEPVYNIQARNNEFVLNFLQGTIFNKIDWEIEMPIDPKEWLTAPNADKVWAVVQKLTNKNISDEQKRAVNKNKPSRIRVHPQPDSCMERIYNHEWQHYQDSRYIAERILEPWAIWIDWLCAIPVKGFELKESMTKDWIIGGGNFCGNTMELIKAFDIACAEAGNKYHLSEQGHSDLQCRGIEDDVLVFEAKFDHPATLPQGPREWFDLQLPAAVRRTKRYDLTRMQRNAKGAFDMLKTPLEQKPPPNRVAAFVGNKEVKEYEAI